MKRGGVRNKPKADSDEDSFSWRLKYIDQLCHRSYGHHHYALSPSSIRDVLHRIAVSQGETISVDKWLPERRSILAHLEDLAVIRRLIPWFTNERKQFEKAPKVYIRDSGLLHCLLRMHSLEDLRANSGAHGHSWEGFCIENLIAAAGERAHAFFYRSEAGEEIDLILEFPDGKRSAIEFKAGNGNVSGGFFKAAEAIGACDKILVKPVSESLPAWGLCR